MDEVRDRRYIKEIISEYTTRFVSWGPPDSWDLDQFKTLENMIFEATEVTVNANTLKRFFQQRTGNPQLATRDALCSFLGYAGYTDFVIKKTRIVEAANAPVDTNAEEPDEKQKSIPAIPPARAPRPNRTYIYVLSALYWWSADIYCIY